jgi:hypothetical protein
MQDKFIFVPCVILKCAVMYSCSEEDITKHIIVICFCYCLLAIIFILKILKNLGHEAILCTEEEILVAFLAFEFYKRFS